VANEDPDPPMEENEQMKTNKQNMDCNNHLFGYQTEGEIKGKKAFPLWVCH